MHAIIVLRFHAGKRKNLKKEPETLGASLYAGRPRAAGLCRFLWNAGPPYAKRTECGTDPLGKGHGLFTVTYPAWPDEQTLPLP